MQKSQILHIMKQAASSDQPQSILLIKGSSLSQPRSQWEGGGCRSTSHLHSPPCHLGLISKKAQITNNSHSPLKSLSFVLFEGTVAFMQVLNLTFVLIYLL